MINNELETKLVQELNLQEVEAADFYRTIFPEGSLEEAGNQQVGKYIKYPKNSNAEHFWKRHSNRIIRRRNEIYRGNQYRKCFDYWWTLY